MLLRRTLIITPSFSHLHKAFRGPYRCVSRSYSQPCPPLLRDAKHLASTSICFAPTARRTTSICFAPTALPAGCWPGRPQVMANVHAVFLAQVDGLHALPEHCADAPLLASHCSRAPTELSSSWTTMSSAPGMTSNITGMLLCCPAARAPSTPSPSSHILTFAGHATVERRTTVLQAWWTFQQTSRPCFADQVWFELCFSCMRHEQQGGMHVHGFVRVWLVLSAITRTAIQCGSLRLYV